MNADRIVKRIEFALRNHEAKTLQSAARDIGDELPRKRISVLKRFLAGIDRANLKFGAELIDEEKVFLTTITNIVQSAIDRLIEEEDREYLSRLSDRYFDILRILKGNRQTLPELIKVLEKREEVIRDALSRLVFVGLVECSGMKQYWELTPKAHTLLRHANESKTAS